MPYLPIQRILKTVERRAVWRFGEVQKEHCPYAVQGDHNELVQLRREGNLHSREMMVLIYNGEAVANHRHFDVLMKGQEIRFPFVWECAPAALIYGMNCDFDSGYKTPDKGQVMLDNARRYVSSGQSPYLITTPDFPYVWAYNGKNAYLLGRNGTEQLT